MEKYEIEKLRDLPVEGVARQLGLEVNARHKALCPFHDDHHASLAFDARRNSCRCFACMDRSLGTIDLVMKIMHVDFIVATRWLADRFGIPLRGLRGGSRSYRGQERGFRSDDPRHAGDSCPKPESQRAPSFDASRYARFFEHPWLSGEARRFLFEERRLDERVVRWCRISSWQDREGTHWLQTPYFDIEGKLIGVQNRNLDYHRPPTDSPDSRDSPKDSTDSTEDSRDSTEGAKDAGEKPRFRFPRGARCGIYNLPVVRRLGAGDELYITEGCSDCWAMLSSGRKAVAIPSATLLSREDAETLRSLAREKSVAFHMFPDRDAPGEQLFMQLRDVLPGLVRHQLPAGCKDFGEAYSRRAMSNDCNIQNHHGRI